MIAPVDTAFTFQQWDADNTPQDTIPAGNTWIIRNLYHSLIDDYNNFSFTSNEPHEHFIRASTRQLVTYLTTQWERFLIWRDRAQLYRQFTGANNPHDLPGRLPFAHICGASGVGKSTEVYATVQTLAGSKAFLSNYSKTFPMTRLVTMNVLSSENIFINQKCEGIKIDEALRILGLLDLNIIVVDGECPEEILSMLKRLALKKHIFLVICESGQSVQNRASSLQTYCSGRDPITQDEIACLMIDGFTLEEYDAAVGIIQHNFDDSTLDLRKERYYYAGGSARIYYLPTINLITNYLCGKILEISKFFVVGNSSAVAVNSLTTYKSGTSIIVSEYVAKKLSKCVDQSFISQASDTLKNNPSWQGWVAELDFLQRVRSCSKSIDGMWEVRKGFGMRDIGWRLRITQLIDYNDAAADLPPHRPTYDSVMNAPEEVLFFVSSKWNNWGFDAVMVNFKTSKRRTAGTDNYQITPCIKVLQCTVANHHSKLLQHVATFMEVLFPLHQVGNNWTYQLITQPFRPPIIEYSILTRKGKFVAHRVDQGVVEGLNSIQKWDATFSVPDKVAKYYFDEDCKP